MRLLIFQSLFVCLVFILAWTDAHAGVLPNRWTFSLILSGLAFHTFDSTALFGGLAGYVLPWICATLYARIKKQRGMGQGDFKFLAGIGVWVGWAHLPMVLMISGASLMVYAGLGRASLKQRFYFGPHLGLAALGTFFFGAS